MRSRKIVAAIFLIIVMIVYVAMRSHLWQSHDEGKFNRHPAHLIYTHHALCRMDCRHISKENIVEILQKGDINFKKTDVNDTPCPTYAVQGYTTTQENIRVIFAQSDSVTKVVTCYDLHQDFECNCPGDNTKNKNGNE